MAFQGVTLPVPEPSVLGLLAVGIASLVVRGCRRNY
ncbi:MAG: PEP-CTERM sorting domain-containing protein [Limisphaerales bacterium]